MIISNRLEEVLIVIPNENYDKALASLANASIINIDEPPEPLKNYTNRYYRKIALEAAERKSRLEGVFKALGLEPRPSEQVTINVKDWEQAYRDVVAANSKLEEDMERLASRITELNARAAELQALVSLLEPVKEVSADVRTAWEGTHVRAAVGVMSPDLAPSAIGVANKYKLLYMTQPVNELMVFVIAGESNSVATAAAELSRLGWRRIAIPPEMPGSPKEAYNASLQTLTKVMEEVSALRSEALKRAEDLNRYYAQVSGLANILRALSLSSRTDSVSFIYGFVDLKDSKKLRRILDTCCDGAYVVKSLGVRRGEKYVPTKVDLPGYFKWFHSIVEMYGTPSGDEIVPTFFMAITMPIIFGLMFPDIGHGLLVLLFAVFYMMPRSRDIAKVASVLGVAGMITGFLAGEFFGPVSAHAIGLDRLWEQLGFRVPPLLSPVDAATESSTEPYTIQLFNEALSMSFWIGAFMLTFGNILGIANDLLSRNYEDLIARRAPLTLLFLAAGLPFLIYFNAYRAGYVIEEALFGLGKGGPIGAFVFYGALASIVWLLIGEGLYTLAIGEGFRLDPIEGFLGMFEGMLLALGNSISFLRIMGLSLAHAGLMVGFTILYYVSLTPHPNPLTYAGAVLLYAVGNLLTAGLEGIVAFAHDLRLHFYEWFNKFYRGLGRPFVPLSTPGVTFIIS